MMQRYYKDRSLNLFDSPLNKNRQEYKEQDMHSKLVSKRTDTHYEEQDTTSEFNKENKNVYQLQHYAGDMETNALTSEGGSVASPEEMSPPKKVKVSSSNKEQIKRSIGKRLKRSSNENEIVEASNFAS